MVKTITIYTAFGHFMAMVERQAELEKEQKKELVTDLCTIDHLLSDYQNALNSNRDFSVHSCPVDGSTPKCLDLVKKSVSCPLVSFTLVRPAEPMAVSPIPTTIETRKLNKATELMMSFWKIHVTARKPKTENEEQIASIFEKMDGLFAATSTSSVASIFGKFEEFLEVIQKENTQQKSEPLVWNSPDQPTFPQLPVFVKSPVDSMKFYKMAEQNTDEMADDELTLTSSSDGFTSSPSSGQSSSSSSTFSSSTTIISRPSRLLTQVRLQREVIRKQKKLIDNLYKLQSLNQKLSNLSK
ncbi:unnamed protein product [Caenorhabditis nigoni]